MGDNLRDLPADPIAHERFMATLDFDGWELESAEARHALHPDLFHIPDHDERVSLRPGQMVQLLFLMRIPDTNPMEVQCEKMWVTINRIIPGGYVGSLESIPVSSEALCPGDGITFSPEHVCGVFIPKTDPRHPEYPPVD